MQFTHYDGVGDYSSLDQEYLPFSSSPAFKPLEMCKEILTSPLPQNVSSALLPCSLNETAGRIDLANPDFAYQTLSQGISQVNSSFNRIDFNTLDSKEFSGDATPYQIVTTFQNKTIHSIFFNPNPAEENDMTEYRYGPNYGIDYVAHTNSMATKCTMATKDCGITARSPSSIKRDSNNMSIPFHCYDDFSGNLGQTPKIGHERAQGWNMGFYEDYSGFRRQIPVRSQSNPFQFYAVAVVDGIGASSPDGSLVDVGNGSRAFALKCEATVYDVRYSLVNGSFYSFNTSKSSPQKASIIKAPLQAGFDSYDLYEAARVAVIPHDMSTADIMSISFSQTAMALASGAFDFDNTTGAASARERWTVEATNVDKAPFWFLIVACLIYSVFGMAMTIVAFCLRRDPKIRGLVIELASEIQSAASKKEISDSESPGSPERASLRSAYQLLS